MTGSEIARRPGAAPALVRALLARRTLRLAAFAGAALLLGCQNLGHRPPPPAQPLQVDAGSRLTLGKPLVFPAGVTTLYLQDNQLVSRAQITQTLPICRLTRASGAESRTIEPTTFTVGSVYYDDREIGSAGQAINVAHLELAADPPQPTLTLSCLWPEGGPSRDFPTSAEIQGAIGAYFSIALVR